MATGIKDKVVILGMGCSKFGERWDCNAQDLMVEAFEEALGDAGIERKQIEAAWLGTAIEEQHLGKSAVPLAMTLRLPYIPVTRVENYCATGTEALRGAVYAVASGAVDIALALGVEKLKDTGYGGLPQRGRGARRPVLAQHLGAGLLRATGRRLPRQARRRQRRPEARDGPHLGEEPRQRRAQPEGSPAQQDHRGRRDARADDRRAAGPVRLLRRQRRQRLRDRDHARHRARPGQARPGGGEGAAGGGVQRPGGAVRPVGRLLLRHHPRGRGAGLPGSRHHPAARQVRWWTCTTASR